jgi:chromosome segregation ATPase
MLRAELEAVRAEQAEDEMQGSKRELKFQAEKRQMELKIEELNRLVEKQTARLQKEAQAKAQNVVNAARKTTSTTGNLKGLSEANQKLKSQIAVLTKENNNHQAKVMRLGEQMSGRRMTKEQEEDSRRALERRRELSDCLQKQVYSLLAELRQMEARASDAENELAEKVAEVEALTNSTDSGKYELQYIMQERTHLHSRYKRGKGRLANWNHNCLTCKENLNYLRNKSTELTNKLRVQKQKITISL